MIVNQLLTIPPKKEKYSRKSKIMNNIINFFKKRKKNCKSEFQDFKDQLDLLFLCVSQRTKNYQSIKNVSGIFKMQQQKEICQMIHSNQSNNTFKFVK